MPEEQTPIRRGFPNREPANGAGSAHHPRRETADLPADEYDALTDLFLGGDMADDSPHAPTLPTPRLEPGGPRGRAVDIIVNVAGGSPEAGLFLAAIRRGQVHQPVAVARIAGSTAVVAVLGDGELRVRPSGTLAEAVSTLSPIVMQWVLEVDEAVVLEAVALKQASRVTIATSADEASVVAAYRAIKTLAGVMSSQQELALMVLDRRVESAARAADKIIRCADAFLGRRLTLVPASAEPLRGLTTLFTGQGVGLAEFMRLLECGGTQRSAVPAPASRERRPGVPGRDATPILGSDRGETAGVPTPSSLAVTIGGDLTSLSVRCPHAEGVEFAVDIRGGLHLLALAGKDGEAAEARAIAQLMTACAWSRAHIGLIAAAESSVHLSRTAAKPTLHLITDQISQVRHLLDAEIRVHLLAPVKSRGGVNWACADLN